MRERVDSEMDEMVAETSTPPRRSPRYAQFERHRGVVVWWVRADRRSTATGKMCATILAQTTRRLDGTAYIARQGSLVSGLLATMTRSVPRCR